jgi:hypothetical protein
MIGVCFFEMGYLRIECFFPDYRILFILILEASALPEK